MGWVWRDDNDDNRQTSNDVDNSYNPGSEIHGHVDRFSTRKIVKSNCRTEEVEPGRFVRKCEKSEQILRDCVGKPSEVVQSNKEYTEEDVTNEMKNGSSSILGSPDLRPFGFPGLRNEIESGSSDLRPFEFPGLRSDIESIERNIFGSISRFFEAAEEMRNGFFRMFDDPELFREDSSRSGRQGVPIDGNPQEGPSQKLNKSESGEFDLSGLVRDV